ncbi:CHASE2 domain-containing protein [Mucilaginibacter limnophilus]|uniref:CHASE2 domain-containing protein n=1 Tax=Mucilaginibacter limnophilus TaxID=1932778 RepID=A0A437MR67_9SPHI|nr:CHASE2 domain-containing protein [Mucilaginibacter limnophilus]RVU00128.1 CHASE2 domain-containing protein [Mucilaginibacter limnophilus]
MLKYLFYKDTFFATTAVFVVLGLLAFVPLNFHILDPFKMAMRDFNYNDLAWSEMGKAENQGIDKDIVVVNIGDAARPEIAAILSKVCAGKPKVAGLDVLLEAPRGQEADSLLQSVIKANNNIVLASRLTGEEDNEEYKSNHFATGTTAQGFANFAGEKYGVMRHFVPEREFDGRKVESFASEIVKKADKVAYNELIGRDHKAEVINYSRKAENFLVIDGAELLNNSDIEVFSNKIVLVGYTSNDPNNILDKHYTPTNNIVTGRGVPDMNGVFIHANIVRMIIKGNYISHPPAWFNWLLAFVLCWLHMAIFIYFYIHRHIWFHLAAKAAQLILTIFFIYLGLLLFAKADIQINMTPTLAVVLLAVDVLYFYEAFVVWLQTKTRYKSIFHHETHH